MEITVSVIGAKGLTSKDPNGLNDPYCKLGEADASGSFLSQDKVAFSEVRHCTLNPVWTRGKYSCGVEAAKVRIEVWDKDRDKSDDFLGLVIVDLKSLKVGDHWVPLVARSPADVVTGSIHFVISKTSFKANEHVLILQQQRLVRVFLSSTFIDMNNEREVIMRKVMVELDKFCHARGVALSYIDMRWGITTEMGDQSMTILRCLQEVDNSRPYFVGFIAQRYGWHQEIKGGDINLQKTFDLAAQHPDSFEDRSVTELEMLHGFLAHPSVPEQHSFFFFRNSDYLKKVPPDDLQKWQDLTPYALSRLEELKKSIQDKADKGLCTVSNYTDPKEIEAPLLNQLKAAIERDYPILDAAQEEFLQRQAEHENYAHRLSTAYVSSVVQFNYLTTAITSSPKGYILVTGESGSGKSAYLANWWRTNQQVDQQQLKSPIFVHFIGASTLASSLHTILLRLFEEINALLVIEDKVPIPTESGLVEAIPKFLDAISAKGGIVIVLDGMNQLPSEFHDLQWLPRVLPANVHIVISSVPTGKVAEETAKRAIKTLKILPLEASEKRELVKKRLGLFGKSIPDITFEKLVSHKLSYSPLFLTTVLVELCIVAYHRIFNKVFDDFMICNDMSSLFERVITRWEQTYGAELAKKVVLLIAASRSGISESVIQAITNAIPADLFPLLSAIRPTTVITQGKLSFYHAFLVEAYSAEDLNSARKELVKYWKAAKYDQPTAYELPWLLSELATKGVESAQSELAEILLNLDNFEVRYWNTLSKLNSKWSLSLYVSRAADYFKGAKDAGHAANLLHLATWLAYAGSLQESIAKHAQDVYTKLNDKSGIAKSLGARCMILEQQGKLVEADKVAKESLSVTTAHFGANSKEVATAISSVAIINMRQGQLAEAVSGFKKALEIRTSLKDEKEIAQSLNQLGVAQTQIGSYADAQQSFNKAISTRSALFGDKHPLVADSIENLANVFSEQFNLSQAKDTYEKALKIKTELYGEPHPAIASTLGNLGELFTRAGKLDEGYQYLSKALEMHKAVFGETNPAVASSLGNLANHALETNNTQEALSLYNKALAIRTQLYGETNQEVAKSLKNVGVVLIRSGQLEKAHDQFKRALEIQTKLFGESSPAVAESQHTIAKLLGDMDKLDASLELHKKVLATRIALFGEVSPAVIQSITSIAEISHKQGKEKDAEDNYRKALDISTKVFGGSHRSVATALYNVAYTLIYNKEEKKEKLQEGLQVAMKSVQVHTEAFGPRHPEVASAYALQAVGLRQLDLRNDALESALKALSIGNDALGENHIRNASFNTVVGDVYFAKGQDVEANKYRARAKAIKEQSKK